VGDAVPRATRLILAFACLVCACAGCGGGGGGQRDLVLVHGDAAPRCQSAEEILCLGVLNPVGAAAPAGQVLLVWTENLDPAAPARVLSRTFDGSNGQALGELRALPIGARARILARYESHRREYLLFAQRQDREGKVSGDIEAVHVGLDGRPRGRTSIGRDRSGALVDAACGSRGECVLLESGQARRSDGVRVPSITILNVGAGGHILARSRLLLGDSLSQLAGLAVAYDPDRDRFVVVRSVVHPVKRRSRVTARAIGSGGELGPAHELGYSGPLAQGNQLAVAYDRGARRMLVAWTVQSIQGPPAVRARTIDAAGSPRGPRPFVLAELPQGHGGALAFPHLQPSGAGLTLDWQPTPGALRVATVSAGAPTRAQGTLVLGWVARPAIAVTGSSARSTLVVWPPQHGRDVNTELLGRVVVAAP
jgi:hypothetical protein